MKTKLLILVILIGFIITTLAFNYKTNEKVTVPDIQGMIVVNPQQLPNFKLTNHKNMPFERKDLLGKWHFISYGYTHCPDICPTTLFSLTQLKQRLAQELLAKNVGFVFYTVDPDRDTLPTLTNYMRYFDRDFIGVRAANNDDYFAFEQSLGIKVKFNNKQQGSQMYDVSHSTAILIVNPEAELQAVILPEVEQTEMKIFESERLFNDYVKVINYYQTKE